MTNEYSAVLAGRYGVGKTSLFKKLKYGCVPEGLLEGPNSRSEEDTGLDNLFYSKKVNGKNIRITLWDTGGQERHDSLTSNYYRNAHAVILVYALDEENSLYALSEWVGEAMEMNHQGDRLVLALWGTKGDLPSSQRLVKPEAVEALQKTYDIPNKLNCTVSLFDESLDEAMLALMEHLDCHLSAHCTVVDPALRDLSKLTEPHPPTSDNSRHRRCC